MELTQHSPFRFLRPMGRPARALVGAVGASRRDELASELQREGYAVGEAANGLEMLAQLSVERFDLILIEPGLPGVAELDGPRAHPKAPKEILLGPETPVSAVIGCALQLVSPLQLETFD
jgi:CheY-like chemotaxis protein